MGNTTQLRDGVLYFISGSISSSFTTVEDWVSDGGIGSLKIGDGSDVDSAIDPNVWVIGEYPYTDGLKIGTWKIGGSAVREFPATTSPEYTTHLSVDPNDAGSFYISGSNISASIYVSSSGRLGFGTTNPESEIDFRADDFKIRKRAIASGIRMNEEGNFESFNNDTTAAATGSEIILKYTRGTKASGADEDTIESDFYDKVITNADDVIGSIRWVTDSGSLDERIGGEAGNIKMAVASSDASGVTGKMSINLAADPGDVSQQLYLVNGATQAHEFTGSVAFNSTISVISNITTRGDLTVGGGDITLSSAATDIDLIDNNSSALSFDASGKTGILEIDTTNSSEAVKMSGDLYVDMIRRASDSSTTTKINLADEKIELHAGDATVKTLILKEGHVTSSGNIWVSGSNNAHGGGTITATSASIAGPIRGKQLQAYHANWKDDAGTTETFIPLVGPPDEQTSGVKESNALIAPCSGTIKEIILRMHWTSTITDPSDDAITWKIYNRPADKKMNGTTELSNFTMSNPTQGSTDANNTRTSGVLNQRFAEGDAIMISMQWASTGPTNSADRIYVTVVVEYDWETIGY